MSQITIPNALYFYGWCLFTGAEGDPNLRTTDDVAGASVGSLYARRDRAALYIKISDGSWHAIFEE